jgi:hypothetical protein
MDRDDERDEAIAEARISGTSSRALAKQYGCTNREIEEAIDRRLSYELDNRQKLRLVKLSLGRIEALMFPFFEKAVKDKDVAAGTLCCKLEERLALLLGLDHPTTQRVDVYQVEEQQQPSGHEQIRAAIMKVARGPNWQPPDANGDGNAVGTLSDLSDDKPNIAALTATEHAPV